VVSALHAHVAFVTKYRRGALDNMPTRCQDAMRQACDDFGASLREFNGETDHVHLLMFYPPRVSVSAPVNSLKGASARRLRPEYTGPVNRARMNGHLWSGPRPTSPPRAEAPPVDHPAVHQAVPPGLTAGRGPTPP
jgi:putative transposase